MQGRRCAANTTECRSYRVPRYGERMATVTIGLNMGPNVLIEDLAGFLADVGTVCGFAVKLQRAVDRNEAIYEVMVGRPDFLPDPEDLLLWRFGRSRVFGWPGSAGVPVPSVERAIRAQLQQSEADAKAEIRVQSFSYQNPAELIILAGGGVVLAVLRMVRDWSARRRLNDAVAEDYESAVRARDELRRELVERFVSGQLRITPEQVSDLLTADVENALLALRDIPLSIEGLDPDEQ